MRKCWRIESYNWPIVQDSFGNLKLTQVLPQDFLHLFRQATKGYEAKETSAVEKSLKVEVNLLWQRPAWFTKTLSINEVVGVRDSKYKNSKYFEK